MNFISYILIDSLRFIKIFLKKYLIIDSKCRTHLEHSFSKKKEKITYVEDDKSIYVNDFCLNDNDIHKKKRKMCDNNLFIEIPRIKYSVPFHFLRDLIFQNDNNSADV